MLYLDSQLGREGSSYTFHAAYLPICRLWCATFSWESLTYQTTWCVYSSPMCKDRKQLANRRIWLFVFSFYVSDETIPWTWNAYLHFLKPGFLFLFLFLIYSDPHDSVYPCSQLKFGCCSFGLIMALTILHCLYLKLTFPKPNSPHCRCPCLFFLFFPPLMYILTENTWYCWD